MEGGREGELMYTGGLGGLATPNMLLNFLVHFPHVSAVDYVYM